MLRDILVMDCDGCGYFWSTLNSNHKIHFAATAAEGLSMLSENIGLVFLNVRLTDMNGIEALQLIKREYPSTPVVIISSSGTEESCLDAFRKGARDYIRKPLKADEILQKIALLMSASQGSLRRQHLSLSAESTPNEDHPTVPPIWSAASSESGILSLTTIPSL